MLWFTENDMKNFLGEIVRITSNRLKVKDWEWLYPTELLEQIKEKNAEVHSKLEAFFAAYRSWHAFHVKIDSEGKSGKLSSAENAELMSLIEKRDSSRKALMKAFRSNHAQQGAPADVSASRPRH